MGDTLLRGRWLALARGGWLALVIFSMGLFCASIPTYYHSLFQCMSTCADAQNITPAFHVNGATRAFLALYFTGLNLFFALSYFVIGWVIFWHKSDDRVALLASFTLITFALMVTKTVTALPGFWGLLGVSISFIGIISLPLFFYVFPDGHFVPRWTRWFLLVALIFWGINMFAPGLFLYMFIHYRTLTVLVFIVLILSPVVAQVSRYLYSSTQVQRQQTRWVLFGTTLGISCFTGLDVILGFFPDSEIASNVIVYTVLATGSYALLILIPLSISFAIFRSRLWEIDSIINRTLLYGALTVSVVVFYALVVSGLGLVFQVQGNPLISLIAISLVAMLVQPLRERLQRAVNRLVYGERDDPYSVLSRLNQRLQTTLAADAVLPTIVETIAQTLKLPYAAISLQQGSISKIVASSGKSSEEAHVSFSLFAQSEQVGELLLAPRLPGEAFTKTELRLLDDLVYQIGNAVHAQRLADDLQRTALALRQSRERIVLAREEERRRLRRDLHDELGPTLAALALSATTVGELIPVDPAAAAQLADELQHELRIAIASVRRLAYELRPPTLDELGLVAAIRERALQLGGSAVEGVQIDVKAPEALPPLPAAVEVAAYRIVQEALTNIVRHAQARHGLVQLTLLDAGETLQLEISDDGIGLSQERHSGVGLFSMRERAEELGGTCNIDAVSAEKPGASGTRVCARIPLVKQASEQQSSITTEPTSDGVASL